MKISLVFFIVASIGGTIILSTSLWALDYLEEFNMQNELNKSQRSPAMPALAVNRLANLAYGEEFNPNQAFNWAYARKEKTLSPQQRQHKFNYHRLEKISPPTRRKTP